MILISIDTLRADHMSAWMYGRPTTFMGASDEDKLAGRDLCLDRLAEREPTVDPLADSFEPEESGVALVGVEHLRMDVECAQGAHASDAQDDLLAQPVLLVAAVEAVGDEPIGRGVVLDVGVEQVQRDPPHRRLPHRHVDLDAAIRHGMSLRDWVGNCHADELAGRAAALNAVTRDEDAQALWSRRVNLMTRLADARTNTRFDTLSDIGSASLQNASYRID